MKFCEYVLASILTASSILFLSLGYLFLTLIIAIVIVIIIAIYFYILVLSHLANLSFKISGLQILLVNTYICKVHNFQNMFKHWNVSINFNNGSIKKSKRTLFYLCTTYNLISFSKMVLEENSEYLVVSASFSLVLINNLYYIIKITLTSLLIKWKKPLITLNRL